MFKDQYLIDHLDYSQSLYVETAIFLELNQNDPLNINTLGVFKHGVSPEIDIQLQRWAPTPAEYYYKHQFVTTYMSQDPNNDELVHFGKRPKADYFNLADCFTEFRPRSGILKAVRPLSEGQVYVDNFRSVNRPRYYFPSTRDSFKYWTSWNTDDKTQSNVGLSDAAGNIKNAAPFIIYNNPVPANKVTLKIQTGMGNPTKGILDAKKDFLTDLSKSSIPERATIQYLDTAGTWQNLFIIQTGTDIFPHDSGTIDLAYMVKNPIVTAGFDFIFKGFFPTIAHLPETARNGDAFCVGSDEYHVGTLYIYQNFAWTAHGDIQHEWKLINPSTDNPENYAVREYVDPRWWSNVAVGAKTDGFLNFHEFVMMKGIRILVTKMYAPSRAFDLIELSPRLFINISDSVMEYTVDKAIAEDDILPVGELSVSTGNITLDNSKLMFNKEDFAIFNYITGWGSLVADKINKNTKIAFFNIVRRVPKLSQLWDYFIPLKTLYVMEKPIVLSGESEAYMPLRDLMFRFEENRCPNLVLRECTLSKAVATLLDSIGFSNYIFQFPDDKTKDFSATSTIIPFFFVNEEMTVAEVLQALAMATQSAMFFDEYNNFVVMPRSHFGDPIDYTLRGSDDLETHKGRANIEEITSVSLDMIADVEIKYTARHLNRQEYAPNQFGQYTTNQAGFASGERGSFLGYAVTPLWNSTDSGDVTSLGAAVLTTDLSELRPKFDPASNYGFSNLVIDVGLWAQYLPWQGMIMMNGEIIKYDAQQVSLQGQQYWVASQEEFAELRGNVGFDQQKSLVFDQIGFRTGLLRIWVDVEKDAAGNFQIVRDGRALYGTELVSHSASASDEWLKAFIYKQTDTVLSTVFDGTNRDTQLEKFNFARVSVPTIFSTDTKSTYYMYNPVHSQFNALAANPTLISANPTTDISDRKVMKSSSFTFTGPADAQANTIYKRILSLKGNEYSTFGCRMGIVGTSSGDGLTRNQNPYGELPIGNYIIDEEGSIKTVSGSGGGICFYTSRLGGSPTSNDGYYFEVTALNSDYNNVGVASADNLSIFANVNFYKINSGTPKAGDAGKDAPVGDIGISLFQVYMYIQVTTGQSAARSRLGLDNVDLIHDLTVDVKEERLSNGVTYRTFYLYIDNILIGTAVDSSNGRGYLPLTYADTEVGLFVRGRSSIQFEHLFAIGGDISEPDNLDMNTNIYRRPPEYKLYSPSAMWASKSLTGGPDNKFRYFEEFGSIARECKKVDLKYSLYPAFIPTIQKIQMSDRAYALTHYEPSPYGASFMLWSQNDSIIDLTQPGTAITISGLTLADNQQQSLRLDDYLLGRFTGADAFDRLNSGVDQRNRLLTQRLHSQTSTISYDSIYIQSSDYARKLMGWFRGFVGEDRMRIELRTFGTPHLQLGDVVSVDYKIPQEAAKEAPLVDPAIWNPSMNEFEPTYFSFYGNNKRYIVRKISVSNSGQGPDTVLSLVEIPIRSDWNASTW